MQRMESDDKKITLLAEELHNKLTQSVSSVASYYPYTTQQGLDDLLDKHIKDADKILAKYIEKYDVNATNNIGMTLLHVLLWLGRIDLAKILIVQPAFSVINAKFTLTLETGLLHASAFDLALTGWLSGCEDFDINFIHLLLQHGAIPVLPNGFSIAKLEQDCLAKSANATEQQKQIIADLLVDLKKENTMTVTRTKKKVILIGDSTFDNSHWVKSDPSATVDQQVKIKLSEGDEVINLAMDGFTTKDILLGASKCKAVEDDLHNAEYFEPLVELAKINNPTHIILSVGGNDIRESLTRLIYADPEQRLKLLDILLAKVQDNYKTIVAKLKEICPNAKIISMLQYTPDLNHDVYYIYYLMQQIQQGKAIKNSTSTYLDVIMYKLFGRSIKTEDAAVKQLHAIMEKAYGPIIAHARENQIPILDMSTTFDHTNKDLYVRQIEPSKSGAAVIADMISHVINVHDFSGPSAMYVKPGCTSGPIMTLNGNFDWRPHVVPRDDVHAREYFNAEYQRQFSRDQSAWYGLYGLFAKDTHNANETVEQAVQKAQNGDARYRKVAQNLGWIETEQRKAKFK